MSYVSSCCFVLHCHQRYTFDICYFYGMIPWSEWCKDMVFVLHDHLLFVWSGLFLCTLIWYLGFMRILLLCSVQCFSMVIWTPSVLSVLYTCVLYFCICTCSAQLSMFHMERCPRNMLIIIIVIYYHYLIK